MINRLVFTLISTSWMWVVYGIQQKWTLPCSNYIFTAVAMILIPILLTLIWLFVAEKFFSSENISGGCEDIEEAHNDFLSDYLGYFFIGIGVDDSSVLIIVYIIIFIFTLLSQRKLFNPLMIIWGYKYYNITTKNGIKLFLITRQKLRNSTDVEFNNIRRINNMSYIDFGR